MGKSAVKHSELTYKGERQPTVAEREKYPRLEPYLPSADLVRIVNLAIQLRKPLLIKGEPGCGKTRLARAVAFELGLYPDYYFEWFVKSTSRARDGLYTFDAIGQLRDAQLAATRREEGSQQTATEKAPEEYKHLGPLGRAFDAQDRRCVVLVDEIDKADIDFPNDLLLELDENRYFIEELDGKEVSAHYPPIVFITSNDEKDLPDAFLRRCLFHYIDFPERLDLVRIIQAHFPKSPETLVGQILDRFLELRTQMIQGNATKKVSIGELLDWFRVLAYYSPEGDMERFADRLLYPGVLLKSWDDYRKFTETMRKAGSAG